MKKKLEYQNPKICFVSLNSYPLLKKNNLSWAGGAEVQQVELAKELIQRGYDITFITYAKNFNGVEKANGIKIIPVYNRDEAGKLSSIEKMIWIWRKMKKVDADIYLYRNGSPGITAIFGIFHQKKVIKSIASNAEMTGKSLIKKVTFLRLLGKIGNLLDIKLSDIVISQNKFQKSMLEKRFKVNSILIKSCFNLHSQTNSDREPMYILWVSAIKEVKQPHLFLKIAEYFPKYSFLMIGGVGESIELFRKIENAASKIQNLKYMDFVSRNKIFDYYKKAILLVNTSKTEGFPNTFLEAWAYSVPIISLNVDPDGVISKYGLGYHSETFNRMINDIKNLLENKESREKMGENGRKYVETYHDVGSIADRYENLFKNINK